MSTSVNTLSYIFIIGFTCFLLVKKDFSRINPYFNSYLILWSVCNVVAFLSHNYWLFAIFSASFLIFYTKTHTAESSLGLFFLLLFSLPALSKEVPGLGGIRYIIDLTWPRILVFSILIPLLIYHSDSYEKRAKSNTDRAVILFVSYVAILSFRNTTITEGFRHALYYFVDIYFPYYVTSKIVSNKDNIDIIFLAIFTAIFIMSGIAILETLKSWHLYPLLIYSLDAQHSPIAVYKYRSGLLRAYSAFGSIPLGIYITITIGITIYLFKSLQNKFKIALYYFLLSAGLLFTLSRGPWSGFALLLLCYILLSKDKSRYLVRLAIMGLITILIAGSTSFGQRMIDLLPIVGSDKEGNISYREQLLTKSINVINKHLFFGTTDVLDDPDMQVLRQGEGIIDIVNTYLQIVLQYGTIGLFLYLSIYLSVLRNLWIARKQSRFMNDTDNYLLSTIFLSTLTSIMFMIGTVGILTDNTGITFHSAFLGLAIAYTRIVNNRYSRSHKPVSSYFKTTSLHNIRQPNSVNSLSHQ